MLLLVVPLRDRLQEIDQEMVEVHRYVVDKYSQKFPELDSLIPQPADFVRTVQVMRNETVSGDFLVFRPRPKAQGNGEMPLLGVPPDGRSPRCRWHGL